MRFSVDVPHKYYVEKCLKCSRFNYSSANLKKKDIVVVFCTPEPLDECKIIGED